MTTTLTPPLWADILAAVIVFAWLFYGAMQDERRQAEEDERRTRHVADDEIDHTYVSGGE